VFIKVNASVRQGAGDSEPIVLRPKLAAEIEPSGTGKDADQWFFSKHMLFRIPELIEDIGLPRGSWTVHPAKVG